MLFWSLVAVGSLAAAVVLAGLVFRVLGQRLPEEHVATVTLLTGRAPAEVFDVVADISRHPAWAKGVTRVERLADRGGCEAWRQFMGRNAFVLVTTRREPPAELVRTIDDDQLLFSGSWTYRIEALPGAQGSAVSITEHGRVKSPIPRAMMYYFFDPAMYARQHLASLARHFGETPRWKKADEKTPARAGA